MGFEVSESRFNMWRTIFAMAHADGIVKAEETEFLNEYLGNVRFSDEQKEVLLEDLKNPKDIGELFSAISESSDRAQFFFFARMLAWCDGDFDEQEKVIIERLRNSQLANIDIDKISSSIRESASMITEDTVKGRDIISLFWDTVKGFLAREK